mgnify:CR=1 FL=1
MDDDLLTALYHAASSEEPEHDGRPQPVRTTTNAGRRQSKPGAPFVDAVGDEVDVDSYG